MRVVLVGEKNGKQVVRWPQCLGLLCALSVFIGLSTGMTNYLLAGSWSPLAIVLGVFGASIVVGTGVINGMRVRPDNLTPVA